MQNERLDYLDMVKGIGIILVVLGHIPFTSGFTLMRTWIYSFHMPLFFMISGILGNYTNQAQKPYLKIIKNGIMRLLIPYMFFELIGILFYMIYHDFSFEVFRWNVFDSIQMYCVVGATWFLPVLFAIETVFYTLKKLLKSDKILAVIAVMTFIPPLLANTENHFIQVGCRCCLGFSFFVLGYCLSDFIVSHNFQWYEIVILFGVNISTCYINGKVEMFLIVTGNIMLYITSAIAGSIFLISIMKKFKPIKMLMFIGQNSLIIMSTHENMLKMISNYSIEKTYQLTEGILLACAIMALEFPVIILLNKYLPFAVGRNWKSFTHAI